MNPPLNAKGLEKLPTRNLSRRILKNVLEIHLSTGSKQRNGHHQPCIIFNHASGELPDRILHLEMLDPLPIRPLLIVRERRKLIDIHIKLPKKSPHITNLIVNNGI